MTINKSHYPMFRCVINREWRHVWIEFEENNVDREIVNIFQSSNRPKARFSMRQGAYFYYWDGSFFCHMRLEMRAVENELKYFLVKTDSVSSNLSYQEFNSVYRRFPLVPIHKKVKNTYKKRHVIHGIREHIQFRKDVWIRKKIPKMTSAFFKVDFKPINFGSNHGENSSLSFPFLQSSSSEDELCAMTRIPSSSILKTSPNRSTSNQNKSISPRKVTFTPMLTIHEIPVYDSKETTPSSPKGVLLKRRSPETKLPLWLLWLRACRTPLGKWGFVFLLLGFIGATVATQGTLLFYTATTTSILGTALLGVNLFRAYPRSHQTDVRTSFVPKIS